MERIHHDTIYWDQFYNEHIIRYNFAIPYCEDKIVLDAACGTGYGSAILAQNKAQKVIGVDISEEAIQEAKLKYGHIVNLEFYCLSVYEISKLNQKFDLIVSFETIEHIDNPLLFIKLLDMNLSNAGKCIISSPNKTYTDRNIDFTNPYHLSELTFLEFKEYFEEFFKIINMYGQSPTKQYQRFKEIEKNIDYLYKRISFLWIVRLEIFIRKIFSRNRLKLAEIDSKLFYADTYDYPLIEISNKHDINSFLTFLFVGEKK
jgi:2-polyprenyl-3-methyl-5-hydroxy-6-metoxy-1,4-benzoquinol methylase